MLSMLSMLKDHQLKLHTYTCMHAVDCKPTQLSPWPAQPRHHSATTVLQDSAYIRIMRCVIHRCACMWGCLHTTYMPRHTRNHKDHGSKASHWLVALTPLEQLEHELPSRSKVQTSSCLQPQSSSMQCHNLGAAACRTLVTNPIRTRPEIASIRPLSQQTDQLF